LRAYTILIYVVRERFEEFSRFSRKRNGIYAHARSSQLRAVARAARRKRMTAVGGGGGGEVAFASSTDYYTTTTDVEYYKKYKT